jgi:hypothetical protein
MRNVFEQLGRDVRTGGALPPPFDEASARDIACMIHDDLTEVGLSTHAIRRVACALLGVSVSAKRCCDTISACQRGAKS